MRGTSALPTAPRPPAQVGAAVRIVSAAHGWARDRHPPQGEPMPGAVAWGMQLHPAWVLFRGKLRGQRCTLHSGESMPAARRPPRGEPSPVSVACPIWVLLGTRQGRDCLHTVGVEASHCLAMKPPLSGLLQSRRRALGLSQAEVAARLGVARAMVREVGARRGCSFRQGLAGNSPRCWRRPRAVTMAAEMPPGGALPLSVVPGLVEPCASSEGRRSCRSTGMGDSTRCRGR